MTADEIPVTPVQSVEVGRPREDRPRISISWTVDMPGRTDAPARPLSGPNRTEPIERLEDETDARAIRDRSCEPSVPWEEAKKKLGL